MFIYYIFDFTIIIYFYRRQTLDQVIENEVPL